MQNFHIIQIGLWYHTLVALDMAREFSTKIFWLDEGFITTSKNVHPVEYVDVDLDDFPNI